MITSFPSEFIAHRLRLVAQLKADVNARKILHWTIKYHLSGIVTSPTFSLHANFFALFVDVGYSVFVMYLPISFYTCYRLLLPKDNINSEVSKMKETSANVNRESESRKYYLTELSYVIYFYTILNLSTTLYSINLYVI